MNRTFLSSFLLLTACQHHPSQGPQTRTAVVYDCAETAVTGDGFLVATVDRVSWVRELGDGMTLGLSVPINGAEAQGSFLSQGFRDQPLFRLFVDFDRRFHELGRRNHSTRVLHVREVASELRIGGVAKREWVPVNVVAVLFGPEFERMMQSEGDFVATLYSSDGTVHQKGVVPKAAFARVEQALREMHARVTEKERDRGRLCTREEYEEGPTIIVS